MRAKKALELPRPNDLKSNNVEDVKNHFRLWREELDKQWRLLFQDIAVIQIDTDGWIYFGGKDAVNSIRIGQSGTSDWVVQHLIGGVYTERLKSSP